MHVRLACLATDSDCQKQKEPTDIGANWRAAYQKGDRHLFAF